MKSHQANPAELAALSAVPQAPFPLTPSALTIQAARAAALRRKALEDEEKEKAVTSDSAEDDAQTLAADGMPSAASAAEGDALEAIAPAPLPEMSGLDTLLAQAGPAATGGGGTAGVGVTTGIVAGGAVLLVAAAASGGSSGSPAPSPAPPAPPNKPASISTSEIQRTGYVIEDDLDGEYTTVGNNAITALKVVDPDGGADLAFRTPTAEELQGKYGTFSFDATSGIWSYTLDNDDPDTQALMGNHYGYDVLTVYSADGTASTAIEVTVEGNLDQFQTSASVNQGDTVLLNTGVAEAAYFDEIYYGSNGYDSGQASVMLFNAGGFALYTADVAASYGYLNTYIQGYSDDTQDSQYGYGYINVSVNPDGSDGNMPVFDGTFAAALTEGTAGAVTFSGSFADADDDGGIYTVVLSSDAWEDGFFTLNAADGITVLGNGTSQVALQGTLAALNNYFDDGEVLLTIDTDRSAYFDDGIDAYLVDDDGNMVSTSFEASVSRVNESLPFAGVTLGDGDFVVADPVFYVPAAGTPLGGGSWDLGDFNGSIELYDEEADYSGSSGYVQVVISVGSGMLTLDSDAFIDGDLQVLFDGDWYDDADGDFDFAYSGVQQITLRSYYTYELENALYDIEYTASESFAVGTEDTLSIVLTDADDNTASVNVSLLASAQNQSPYFSLAANGPFVNLAIVDDVMSDGETYMDGESYATAQLHEDQHVSFEGIAINDPDAAGSNQVYVYFYAYEYQYDTEEFWNGVRDDNGGMGLFIVDDAFQALVTDSDEGYVEFVGSIDEINAMLAAGGLTYAPPPDYDAVSTDGEYSLALEMYVDDLGSAGYGDASGLLYVGIDMIPSEDPVFILGPSQQVTNEMSVGVTLYNMLDGEYVFDAEYNGNGSGGELMVTNVTIAGTTGTGTLDQDEIDGDWVYFLGEGDVGGDTVVFNYTISDGTSTWMNTLELEIQASMPG